MEKNIVSVRKSHPDKIFADYFSLLDEAGLEQELDKDSVTILKDNISWHLPMPGANTTPWQLEATIRYLKERGYEKIVAVENQTVVTRASKGEHLNKYDKVYDKYDIPVYYNFKPEHMEWVDYEPKSEMNVLGEIYPEGFTIPDFFVDKNIIHLPTMKCHIYTTTTGAMKNAFGGLLNTKRHYTHSVIHQTLVDLLKIQREIHSGVFAIMDGTTAGNGPGPRTLRPVRTDLILASKDQVAIDAVAAKLMGFEPLKDIKYVSLAHEQELGKGNLDQIEIKGIEIDNFHLDFEVGNNFASIFGDLFWFSPLKILQKMLFRTALVHLFILGSNLYHDKLWWNIKGKKIFSTWQQESPWGQLFQEY